MLCEKKFVNNVLKSRITGCLDAKLNVWFRGKGSAKMLGYKNTRQAIIHNVDENDRKSWGLYSKPQVRYATFINESGLYQLILSSKKEEAKKFTRWVTSEVLPSIRKYGQFRLFNNPNSKQFKIENENDLHTKVVHFLKNKYPHCITISPMGELQVTSYKRFEGYKKGYMKGSPDLLILIYHKH